MEGFAKNNIKLNKFLHKILENKYNMVENLKAKYDGAESDIDSEGSDGSVDYGKD